MSARLSQAMLPAARAPHWSLAVSALLALAPGVATCLWAQQPVTIAPVAMVQAVEPLPPTVGLASPTPGPAQALSLPDLEQIALSNNPSLARAGALVGAARGNWIQVGIPPNFSYGYLGQQLGAGGIAEQHAFMVDGEIVTGHKLMLNREVASHEVARAEQNFAAQERRVITDVRIAFYDALLAQRGLELAEQLLNTAQLGQQAASRLTRAGETSKVDLLQANIEVYGAENGLTAARNRHFAAWQTLTAVLGVPQLAPTPLCGDLNGIPGNIQWDECLNRLLSISPEIAAAVANVDRAYAALARARHEPIPNLRFQGGVMQDQGIGGKTDGIVQLLLPLPIWDRNQGGIRQAESELMAAEQAVHQLELDLQNRLAPVFERYSTARNQMHRFRERILPDAQESLSLVRRGYEAGEFPFLTLLAAQRTYVLTNVEYLQTLRDLQSAAAEIDGQLLRNSLAVAP